MSRGLKVDRALDGVRLLLRGKAKYLAYKISPRLFRAALAMLGYGPAERFSIMQKTFYEGLGTLEPKAVVGFYDDHEKFPYEKYLLDELPGQETRRMFALDFGCGMGRMVRRMAPHFKRVDGIDIARANVVAARKHADGIEPPPVFYVNDGRDLAAVPTAMYQFVYSTIAMQHIPVHSIRMSLFREFYRVLDRGTIAVQLVYSATSEEARRRRSLLGGILRNVDFYEWEDNRYDVLSTNGAGDVIVTGRSLPAVVSDLERLGFTDVRYKFSEPPHETIYDKWIYFHGRK